MKKSILIIGIVLLAALFALSSCDMILNAVYPEFNPDSQQPGMGSNKVHINMNITSIDTCSFPVKIALVPLNENATGQFQLGIKEAWIQEFWCANTIDFWFDQLPNKAYRVFIWAETLDNNGKPGADEPSSIGVITNDFSFSKDIFDFRGATEPKTIDGTSTLDIDSRLDYKWIEAWNNGTNVDDNTSNKIHITFNVYNIETSSKPVKVALVPLQEIGAGIFELKIDRAWIQEFWNLNTIDFEFNNLGKDAYRLFVWAETVNNDNKPAADEPSAIATISDGSSWITDMFDFRNVNEAKTIQATSYLDTYSRIDYQWITAWNPTVVIKDYSFTLSGPNVIDRAWPPYVSDVYIYRTDPTNIIQSVQFQITDGYYNSVSYSGNSNFQYSGSFDFTNSKFQLDLANQLNPAFSDDDFWINSSYLIIRVLVTYNDGATYQNEYWVSLYDSVGSVSTYYNLYVNPQFTTLAPYGYAYVYVVDHANQNTLFYNSAYLDGSGYYPFSFYGIEDPDGADQDIIVYLYDQYWNYVGYYTQPLDGVLSGDVTYYIGNDGIFSTTSTSSLYYDINIYPQFSSTASFGYAYVYLFDTATGSTIAYNSAYLDVNGYYPFSFYGVYDPTGANQQVAIYIYDQYWNYVGYYSHDVETNHSTILNYYVYDYGVYTIF